MGRELSDLDFAAYRRDRPRIENLFISLGYVPYITALVETQGLIPDRAFFHDQHNNRIVDVFFDRLEMCHTLEFKGRLEEDFPTIPLADLLLEKLQIVKLNVKDVKDVVLLLLEHTVGDSEVETINSGYIGELLAKDWGFYFTVMTNLQRLATAVGSLQPLTEDQRSTIRSRIQELGEKIEAYPKTMQWKIRARVGTRRRWYRDVEEVVR